MRSFLILNLLAILAVVGAKFVFPTWGHQKLQDGTACFDEFVVNGTNIRQFPYDRRIPRQSKRHGHTSLRAVPNLSAWNKFTNIVYMEQPVGVGYTRGTLGLLMNEGDVAREFIEFWKNFVDAFGLHARKVVRGGVRRVRSANSELEGVELWARITKKGNYTITCINEYLVPSIMYAMLNANAAGHFNVTEVFMVDPIIGDKTITQHGNSPSRNDARLPAPLAIQCNLLDGLHRPGRALRIHRYHQRVSGPIPHHGYMPAESWTTVYSSRLTAWSVSTAATYKPRVIPCNFGALPRVIERADKNLIINGKLDLVAPTYAATRTVGRGQSGTGMMGNLHEERGLTLPTAAFRQLEWMLGRVESMNGEEYWTSFLTLILHTLFLRVLGEIYGNPDLQSCATVILGLQYPGRYQGEFLSKLRRRGCILGYIDLEQIQFKLGRSSNLNKPVILEEY
ncbi:hypothetical protein B0H19DRAFT_1084647 [Mycena capillaripes]|nr:hypothetical protein B0H19DRAFT_1084647 [Mycena capillaripes]